MRARDRSLDHTERRRLWRSRRSRSSCYLAALAVEVRAELVVRASLGVELVGPESLVVGEKLEPMRPGEQLDGLRRRHGATVDLQVNALAHHDAEGARANPLAFSSTTRIDWVAPGDANSVLT